MMSIIAYNHNRRERSHVCEMKIFLNTNESDFSHEKKKNKNFLRYIYFINIHIDEEKYFFYEHRFNARRNERNNDFASNLILQFHLTYHRLPIILKKFLNIYSMTLPNVYALKAVERWKKEKNIIIITMENHR